MQGYPLNKVPHHRHTLRQRPLGSLKTIIGGPLGPGMLAITHGKTRNLHNNVTMSIGDVNIKGLGSRALGAIMTLNPPTDNVVATVTGTVTGTGTATRTFPTPIQPL